MFYLITSFSCLVLGWFDWLWLDAWYCCSAVWGIEILELIEFGVQVLVGVGLGMLSSRCGYRCDAGREGHWDVGLGYWPGVVALHINGAMASTALCWLSSDQLCAPGWGALGSCISGSMAGSALK